MSESDDHQIIHGNNKPTSQVPVAGLKHVAPLPEGLKEEVNDGIMSGGGSAGHGSGKGGGDVVAIADKEEGKFDGDDAGELDVPKEKPRKKSNDNLDDEDEDDGKKKSKKDKDDE